MKNAVLISAYDYYDVRVRYIYEALEEKGYAVNYYIASFNHYRKLQNKACREEATMLKTIGYKKNVSIARLISCVMFSMKVYKEIKTEKPELVYSIIPPNSLSWMLWKGKNKYGYRLVLDIIDSWPESFSIANRKKRMVISPLLYLWKKIRDISIVNADVILGVSTAALEVFPKCKCEQKLFYPMPCKHAQLDLKSYIDTEVVSFCYVGGINRLLNMDRIVAMLREVACSKAVCVHIIGNGEKKEEFLSRLRENGVKVFDHGELYDWADKFPIYSSCSFGLNIPIRGAKVTMSLKGAEYLCASLPLLNEASGDTEMMIEKYTAGINSRDLSVRAVAERICSLSRQEIIEMKKNANALYEREFESKLNFDFFM